MRNEKCFCHSDTLTPTYRPVWKLIQRWKKCGSHSESEIVLKLIKWVAVMSATGSKWYSLSASPVECPLQTTSCDGWSTVNNLFPTFPCNVNPLRKIRTGLSSCLRQRLVFKLS